MSGDPAPVPLATASDDRDESPPAVDVRPVKPLVYVAGPVTADPFGCVRNAIPAWRMLRSMGCAPLLPQLSVLHEMIAPEGYAVWMDHDLDLVTRCDALVRLPGDSAGADAEMSYAQSIGLPVFRWPSFIAMAMWLKDWQRAAWVRVERPEN